MKILSIEVENYKCYKNITIGEITNFHTFIGRNSSGKTSILEVIEMIKDFPNHVTNITEKVYGGISKNESKNIVVKIVLLLSFDERKKYFHYLHLPDELIEGSERTEILNRINISLTITVNKESAEPSDNRILLTGMGISNTNDTELISILRVKDDIKKVLDFSEFEPGLGPNIHNNPYVDEHLKKLKVTSNSALGYFGSTPAGNFQYDFLQDFIKQLEVIHSIRNSIKVVESKFIRSSDVDEHGEKLIGLMLTMFHDRHTEFKAIEDLCKRIFPEIDEIRPYLLENGQFTMVIVKKNLPVDYSIDLRQEGIGVDQAFIIIWKIATTEAPRIWLLDEPELHLHPGAQKLLYDFLKDQTERSMQIFVATQSMIFIHKSALPEVSIIADHQAERQILSLKDLVVAEKINTIEGLDQIRNHLYDALGYDATFAFEPSTVVMVEGLADESILTSFSQTLGFAIDLRVTRFIPLGNKRNIERYSPVLAFSLFGKKCIIVVDNDNKHPLEIMNKVIQMERVYKNRINHESNFSEKNFYLYPSDVYSIEFYLLEAEAICKTANKCDPGTVTMIKSLINESLTDLRSKTLKPKDLLHQIWESDLKCGPYHEVETASSISRNVSRKHLEQYPEILSLVKEIS